MEIHSRALHIQLGIRAAPFQFVQILTRRSNRRFVHQVYQDLIVRPLEQYRTRVGDDPPYT